MKIKSEDFVFKKELFSKKQRYAGVSLIAGHFFNHPVVCKTLSVERHDPNKKDAKSENLITEFKNEIDILNRLKEKQHNNILNKFASFEEEEVNTRVMVFEHMDGDLFDLICAINQDTELKFSSTHLDLTYTILKKIADGLSFLHRQNIVHNDLKPENVVYKAHPDNP